MQVILTKRVRNLGNIGDIVTVVVCQKHVQLVAQFASVR